MNETNAEISAFTKSLHSEGIRFVGGFIYDTIDFYREQPCHFSGINPLHHSMEITATGYLFISFRINRIKADVYPIQTGIASMALRNPSTKHRWS